MSEEKRKIDESTLDALLYLSRLSPECTNLAVLKEQVDQIVGYFDILSEYTDNETGKTKNSINITGVSFEKLIYDDETKKFVKVA